MILLGHVQVDRMHYILQDMSPYRNLILMHSRCPSLTGVHLKALSLNIPKRDFYTFQENLPILYS